MALASSLSEIQKLIGAPQVGGTVGAPPQFPAPPPTGDFGATSMSRPPPKGFFRGVAETVLRPIAEVGVSLYNVFKATGELTEGDIAEANRALDSSRRLPFFGETKTALTGKETTREMIGKSLQYGTDIGSLYGGAGVARTTLGQGILRGGILGAKQFATVGGVGSLGTAIEQKQGPLGATVSTGLGAVTGGLTGGVTGGIAPVAGVAVGSILRGGQKLYQRTLMPLEERITKTLNETIERGFKPLKAAFETRAKEQAYRKNMQVAMRVINEFKPTFQDDTGNMIARNPATRQEAKQAAESAMDRVFEVYNFAQKQATGRGAQINLSSAADELEKAAKNTFIKDNHPALAADLERRAAAYRERGTLDPGEAQEWIKSFNNSLNAFYRNPAPNEASKAAIDALVVNRLRQATDEVIEGTTGAEYQGWKSIYGVLKVMQKEAARGAAMDARRGAKGFFDLTDIFSAGELAAALATMNPVSFVRSGAMFGVKQWFKFMNNPNTWVQRGFKALERTKFKLPATTSPRPQFPALPPGPIPMGPGPDTSFVRGVPAQVQPFRMLSPGALPMEAGADISGVRGAEAARTFGRVPGGGKFKRVFTAEERGRMTTPPTVFSAQPPKA